MLYPVLKNIVHSISSFSAKPVVSGTLYSKLASPLSSELKTDERAALAEGQVATDESPKEFKEPFESQPVRTSSPLAATLFGFIQRSETKTQLIKAIAEVSRTAIDSSFLWYIEADPHMGQRALALTSADQTALWQAVADDVVRLLKEADSAGKVVRTAIHSNQSSVLIGTSLVNENGSPESIIAITPANHQAIASTEEFLSLFALVVHSWTSHRSLQGVSHSIDVYQKLVQLANILTGVDSAEEAYVCSVNFVREMLHARQVAIALRPLGREKFRVEAISDIETFDRTGELCTSISALAHYACQNQKPMQWNSAIEDIDSENLHGEREVDLQLQTEWQRRFCNLTSSDVASAIPIELRNGDQVSLLIAHQDDSAATQNSAVAEAYCKTIANQLGLLQRSSRGAIKISLDKTFSVLRKKTGKVIMALVAAVVLILLTPMPYIVKSDCQLEPVQRRFVAAPFDAVVDHSLVQNGDVVEADQVLAELDGRQLRIELSGLQASLQSEQKKHDSALANRDVALSQIALLEVKRLKAEIELTKNRLKNLVIRSPIAGIVVSGDLEKAEGAPVEIGQNLFEIAPLDRMLVEVEVVESEVRYARPGQPVQVLFDAFPFDKFEGNIVRIHPRAEIRQDQSIFVAEVELENSNGQLRPGMKGRCRIRSDWHPLGWNLFHHSFENVRGWLVW